MSELPVWQVPECAVAVEYLPAVLDEIRLEAVQGFCAFPRGGAETGGVLFGVRENGSVCIRAFRTAACEHAMGPSFTLSAADHERFAGLLRAPESDAALQGMRPVGWYHSHTRSEIFLSEQDLEVHHRYFTEEWQVALVLRPSLVSTRAGFFARDASGALKADASYREFELTPLSGRALRPVEGEAQPAVPDPPPSPEAGPPAAEPVPEPAIAPPSFLDAAQPRSAPRRWRWILAVLTIVLCASGFATRDQWERYLPPFLQGSASLNVVDSAGQLQIRWDPSSRVVRRALGGQLAITDGPDGQNIPLDPQRLRSGAFTYARLTGNVDVRLMLFLPDGWKSEQYAGFAGQLPPAKPSPEEIELRRRGSELEQELQRARTELINQTILTQQLQKTIDELQHPKAKPRPEPKPGLKPEATGPQ